MTTRLDQQSPRTVLFSLAAVILASFGVGLSFGVGVPLASLMFEEWQQPKWLIGVMGAIPSLAVLITLPFGPRLAARFGAVPLILLGCLLAGVGFLALYLFQTPEAWLIIRFVMSAGLTLPWLLGETWINTLASPETRGRVISVYAISFFAGFAVGPVILQIVGLTGWMPYAAGIAGPLLAGLPIALAARVAPDLTHDEGASGLSEAIFLSPLGYLCGFLGGVVEMSSFSLLSVVSLASGFDQAQALWLITLLSIGGGVFQLGIGWLSDKFPRTWVVVFMCLGFMALVALLPWALLTSLNASAALSLVLGGVVLGFYTVGLAIVGDDVSLRDLASANAIFLIMYQLGGILGPAAAGVAMEWDAVWGFVASLSIIVLGGLLVVLRWWPARPL